jgi:hypothetical protein
LDWARKSLFSALWPLVEPGKQLEILHKGVAIAVVHENSTKTDGWLDLPHRMPWSPKKKNEKKIPKKEKALPNGPAC